MKILIVGAGEVGFNIAARLVDEGHDVTIVDRDEAPLARATEVLDIQGVRGHGARPGVLQEAGVARADMIVAVTDLDEVNMIACLTASILGPSSIIKIARVRDDSYLDSGIIDDARVAIDLAINPERVSADKILNLLRYRDLTEVVDFDDGKVQLLALHVRPTSPLAGLRFIELRDRFDEVEVLIAAIHRAGSVIIPGGHDVILPNDEVFVVSEGANVDATLRALGVSITPVSRVMIAGGSKIGRYLAADLAARGLSPKLIDEDERRARQVAEQLPDAVVLHGSPTNADLLIEENAGEMEAFIACGRDEEVNIMSALLAQQLGAKRVIVTTNRSDYPPLIKHVGVDVCISPRLVAVNSILHFIRKGRVVAARALGQDQAAEAIEFEADLMSDVVGKPLRDLRLPRGALIASIIRDDVVIVPHGGTVIEAQDRVIVVALTTALDQVAHMAQRRIDRGMRVRLSWLLRLALLGHLTGVLMLLLSVAMLPSALLALFDSAPDTLGHFAAVFVSFAGGLLLFVTTRAWARDTPVGHREGFLIVGIGWLVAGLVGALPFYFYALLSPAEICQWTPHLGATAPVGYDFCSFTNSAFESISGFTTTGASIITDGLWGDYGLTPDGRVGLPRGILLWRSMTHFLGGMGIVVLGVAILPLLGVGGMQLFKAEVPGPTTDKLAPRVGETAKLLWKVYLLLSTVLFVLLAAGGLDAFEAVCHTMSTMATGGFSTRAASAAGLNSPYAEWVMTVFMYLAGMNFTLHFMALRGTPGVYWRDPEWKAYTGIIVVCTVATTASLSMSGQGFGSWESLRIAAFQVLSIITTTGYASHDFELWTYAPTGLFVILLLMLCGGMAGSTGGGIKVVRHVLAVKLWVRELFYLVHPRAVRSIRLGNKSVPDDITRAVAAFIAVYLALVVLGMIVFIADGHDLVTSFTCSASSLGNVGPGLGEVGPYDNYAVLSGPAKWFSAFLMVLGRLELYTLLVLLTPAFWRR